MSAVYSTTKYFTTFTEVQNYIVSLERDAADFGIEVRYDIYIKYECKGTSNVLENISYKIIVKAYEN